MAMEEILRFYTENGEGKQICMALSNMVPKEGERYECIAITAEENNRCCFKQITTTRIILIKQISKKIFMALTEELCYIIQTNEFYHEKIFFATTKKDIKLGERIKCLRISILKTDGLSGWKCETTKTTKILKLPGITVATTQNSTYILYISN